MRGVVLSAPFRRWECPSCGRQEQRADVEFDGRVRSPMHDCPRTGITTPFVQLVEGQTELRASDVRHRLVEREDYIGTEVVRLSATGRPVMAVLTERADGSNDAHVFAGMAMRD